MAANQKQHADETAAASTPVASPSAVAARRARRIGGRPAPRPDAGTWTVVEAENPAARARSTVQLDKPRPPRAPLPGRSRPGEDRPALPGWLNWAPAGVLGAGAVVMAVLLVVFSHGVWWGSDNTASTAAQSGEVLREQVLSAAKSCVAVTNTYKYTELDSYESKALACTTGEFTDKLRDTIERLVKVNAPRIKAAQTAQINRGGIEAVSPGGKQWTVLVFGQLAVTNTNYPSGRTDPFGAQVRMEQVNGKWLMSDLQSVSNPVG